MSEIIVKLTDSRIKLKGGEYVRDLVRCKDCVYGEVDDKDFPTQYLCNHHGCDWNDENHYCSYGERKEE